MCFQTTTQGSSRTMTKLKTPSQHQPSTIRPFSKQKRPPISTCKMNYAATQSTLNLKPRRLLVEDTTTVGKRQMKRRLSLVICRNHKAQSDRFKAGGTRMRRTRSIVVTSRLRAKQLQTTTYNSRLSPCKSVNGNSKWRKVTLLCFKKRIWNSEVRFQNSKRLTRRTCKG